MPQMSATNPYLIRLQQELQSFFKADKKKVEFFVFGSSLTRDRFGDIDVGVRGEFKEDQLWKLRDRLTESTFPYTVDIINFNHVSEAFKNNVFSQPVLWLQRSP